MMMIGMQYLYILQQFYSSLEESSLSVVATIQHNPAYSECLANTLTAMQYRQLGQRNCVGKSM